MYESLTVFLERMRSESSGEWVFDNVSKGTLDDPFEVPWVDWSPCTSAFVEAVYAFQAAHPEYGLEQYGDVLSECGLEWDAVVMERADVSNLDGRYVMALILGGIRADRFCEGQLKRWIDNGVFEKWLSRLKELDDLGEGITRSS